MKMRVLEEKYLLKKLVRDISFRMRCGDGRSSPTGLPRPESFFGSSSKPCSS